MSVCVRGLNGDGFESESELGEISRIFVLELDFDWALREFFLSSNWDLMDADVSAFDGFFCKRDDFGFVWDGDESGDLLSDLEGDVSSEISFLYDMVVV